MALRQKRLDGCDMVDVAVERLREFCPPEGYYVAFGGGKDSIVVRDLIRLADVKCDLHYHVTTVDPPELLHYIRQYHPDVQWDRPEKTMWQLIVDRRMPPTRMVRYCCEALKETGGKDRTVVTGVRWAESARRSHRGMFETCKRVSTRRFLHPIIDWTTADVWEYIRSNHLPYCSLYDEGFDRIGCIMCPMAEKQRHQHAVRWPKYAAAYKRAMDKMVAKRIADGLPTQWKDGQEAYNWWMKEPTRENDEGCWLFE